MCTLKSSSPPHTLFCFTISVMIKVAPCRAVKVWDVPGGAAVCGLCGLGGLEERRHCQAEVPDRLHGPQEGRQSPADLPEKVSHAKTHLVWGLLAAMAELF